MAEVRIVGLEKKFGSHVAVDNVDLTVSEGEFITLLGPSGCGKTTTLRCLAGLEAPTAGEIYIGNDLVAAPRRGILVPPNKRGTGMVFQSYALWPHMTVRANVAYPLRMAKRPKAEIGSRVDEILEQVGLADRGDQMATALSGGQQQRVALARAMVARPRLIFYDEPLSNLDAQLRYTMRTQIRALHDVHGYTSVYVTHDQEEAIALADRVVVMNSGRIEQVGTPPDLYERPATAFVADFMGFQNIWQGQVAVAGRHDFDVVIPQGPVRLTVPGRPPVPVGGRVSVAFRNSHVRPIGTNSPAGGPRLDGIVVRSTYLGSGTNILIDVGGLRLRTRVEQADLAPYGPAGPKVGDAISMELQVERAVVLAEDPAASGLPAELHGELAAAAS